MTYTIIWTPKSQETFRANIEYLSKEWEPAVLNDFLDRVREIILKIQSTPLLFPLYKKNKSARRCVVTEQITLYYRIVDESTIDLITFWNVYQNPKKLKL